MLNTDMAPKYKDVIYLYGEPDLQKTVRLDEGASVSRAKEIGMEELSTVLSTLPGVGKIEIDPQCTDVYPIPVSEDAKLKELNGNITMVMYPMGDLANRTPSPVTAALTQATTSRRALHAQRTIEPLVGTPTAATSSTVKLHESGPTTTADSQMADILSRLAALEVGNAVTRRENAELGEENVALRQDNAELREGNAALRQDNAEPREGNAALRQDNAELREGNAALRQANAELREENAALRQENAELRKNVADLTNRITSLEQKAEVTMQALLGDRVAINHVRRHVLLDLARNKLAELCGFNDWSDWKSRVARDSMIDFARTRLTTGQHEVSTHWTALAGHPNALDVLVLPNPIRSRGDAAAPFSSKNPIGESILSMQVDRERNAMMAIFLAYYDHPVSFD